jgi:hypothetical protein
MQESTQSVILVAVAILFILVMILVANIPFYNIRSGEDYSQMDVMGRNDLKSGDILLTRCRFDFLPLYFIKNLTYTNCLSSLFTHVGIIYEDIYGEFDNIYGKTYEELTGTASDASDVTSTKRKVPKAYPIKYIAHYMVGNQSCNALKQNKKGCSGLILSELNDFLDDYKGNVCIRRLNKPLTAEKHLIMKKFISKHADTPFNKSQSAIINCAFKLSDTYDESSFICSNFLMSVLKNCGVIKNKYNNVTPVDLSSRFDRMIMNDGYQYSDECILLGSVHTNTFI